MKTAQGIYTAYGIMPTLQLHQLRVAAVGKLVSDARGDVFGRDVVLACLFHDMGNIIKSELAYFPDFTEPEGLAYWEQQKEMAIEKYGNDAHQANLAIAREIGLSEHIIDQLDRVGFSRLGQVLRDDSMELKIVQYADMRVGPRGVLSLEARLREGRVRYHAKGKGYYDTEESFARLIADATALEAQLFSGTQLRPSDIGDTRVEPLVSELRQFPVA